MPPNPDPDRSQRILRRLALLGPSPPAFYPNPTPTRTLT